MKDREMPRRIAERISPDRLLTSLEEFGAVGRDANGRLSRLTGSDADRLGRDWICERMRDLGLAVCIDQVGNIFGTWNTGPRERPVMIGSHVDSVADAGILDGAYGVLAGLEVVNTLRHQGVAPARPITVAAFTNEEGVRYTPDMLGSLVHVGELSVREAMDRRGIDGSILGEELRRIGYRGTVAPGTIRPSAFVELHVEQGPVLDTEGVDIGAVDGVQGLTWLRVTVRGQANHAGTTPMDMRRNAGLVGAEVVVFLEDLAQTLGGVATVGSIRLTPNNINVIPRKAEFTVDIRHPDPVALHSMESSLKEELAEVARRCGCEVQTEALARATPVRFEEGLVRMVERSSEELGLTVRRLTSGAGHDAQVFASNVPTVMIFVPSTDGISHNPREHTPDDKLVGGANVLLAVTKELATGAIPGVP